MKFLVTGGTGFIGARVVVNLWERGIPVIVADLDLNIAWTKQIALLKYREDPIKLAEIQHQIDQTSFVNLDVSNRKQVNDVFCKFPDITNVIHLAYLISAELDADQISGVAVNIHSMITMLDIYED